MCLDEVTQRVNTQARTEDSSDLFKIPLNAIDFHFISTDPQNKLAR